MEERLKAIDEQMHGKFQLGLELREGDDDEDEESGSEDDVKVRKDSIWENHFEDSEKLTTVTVIEDFDQEGLENVEGIAKRQKLDDEETEKTETKESKKPDVQKPEKKKKKAFRYGTKAERRADRDKAKLKRQAHAKPNAKSNTKPQAKSHKRK